MIAGLVELIQIFWHQTSLPKVVTFLYTDLDSSLACKAVEPMEWLVQLQQTFCHWE